MKYFFMTFIILFLVGCQTENSPLDALTEIYENDGYAEVLDVYETVDVDEGRVLIVFHGELNGKTETYVAYIIKESGVWQVNSATNIGLPTNGHLNGGFGTDDFSAGYFVGERPQNIVNEDNVVIAELENSDYKIWIEVN
ncbi:hypothetical protein BKP35_00455 [Anaerobacillus arseniciselenatis]|uniref:Uncharacterized protein n=1 Tax=Anaerobacillus arseniciselenatis TaxID=85682 RepID=A0A1S2LSL1_9BACI|nr:hypothetical protein [Anaerobacillus arseniciselenatis]OIJ15501.1 hypothetical protein BKP35_00455 [Anaerobacillus arseniciselenatis]